MTLLKSCLEVYQTVTETFPAAKAEAMVGSKGTVYLKISPTERIPSYNFLVRSAVIRKVLSQTLCRLQEWLRAAEIVESKPLSLVNVKKLTTDISLTGWQKFRRVLYEKEGKSCIKAITDYLQSPYDLSTISYLGLAPYQVEEKGETYQAIIALQLESFCRELKAQLSCREVVIEDKSLVLTLAENQFYGEGIDIRRINKYLALAISRFNLKKAVFGRMSTKKLALSCDEKGLFLKSYTFLERRALYTETPAPLFRLNQDDARPS